jgi:mRNA interferase YafQ
MLKSRFGAKFKKDFKKIKKQGADLEKLKKVMEKLQRQETLEKKHRDHDLIGNWNGFRECHIENDWLLIYKIEEDQIIFARTGSHSELL